MMQGKTVSIPTRWAATVSPQNAWREYPRPQMVRPHWENLNGLWDYAVTADSEPQPAQYQGRILVPYPLESALSGVQQSLEPNQGLWYRRTFQGPAALAGERTLLHFGAIDYEATVYLNGQRVGGHSGGYQAFTLDITEALKAGENELIVKVYDPTDLGPNPYGKQRLSPKWAFYTPSSGIWQTVWLERVPSTYIDKLRMTPDVDRSELQLEVMLKGTQPGVTIEAVVTSGAEVIARKLINGPTALQIDRPRLWSPDDPYLYDLEVRVLKEGKALDAVTSYFGMRKIEVKRDDQGKPRIYLNDQYTYNLAVVDQGFWPDGLYTAPTDEALRFDLQAIKALGFNTVRKHIKIEPARWYTHCDQLGLLVWQDMPSGNNDSAQGRAQFEQELKENLAQLHNHPSITTWVLFNEGWGTYDLERLAKWMKEADPSRLLNAHSGPYNQVRLAQLIKGLEPSRLPGPFGQNTHIAADYQATQDIENWAGDIADIHYYPGPRMVETRGNLASVTGEHGSFGVYIEGHVLDELKEVGKGLGAKKISPAEMLKVYADSIEQLKALEAQGQSGSGYFEIVDVETEQQGFLTYDRKVAKVPIQDIARLNARLVPQAKNYAEATAGFSVTVADQTPESARYDRLIARYEHGERDLSFLKRLALIALRQNDPARATEVANAFIMHSPKPYSKESWETIVAITGTSKDKSFELLSTQASEINAALGAQTAQKKMLEIIVREAIEPHCKEQLRSPDWAAVEQSVAAHYGEIGREAIYGVQMMYHLVKGEWASFGQSFTRYFASAIPRSAYPLHSLSYQVLKHVDDIEALNTAVRAMEWVIDAVHEFKFGRYDPVEFDTYANLLYKLGRSSEALEWQQKAVALSDGRDREIAEHLQRMKAGMPTWGST